MRYEDWQKRFWAELERQRVLPFAFGTCDCVLYAASVADAVSMDGRYVERARSAFSWSDASGAAKLLEERSLRDMVEDVLGPMQPWPRLTMGDIVLCARDGSELVAVHDGSNPIAKDDLTLVTLLWSTAVGGWKVA